ncbi:M14-type cytosolic carboxypeptidase [Catalinimonas niigatensis]|uniref:M14-type cytosolic carboxypeptidase n=1 Tax=Catalinimonas niigatensis TaxID=1397264 RepID=UPI002AA2A176|nr:M14-type cytosolic carboxypeptidase [Catalinimonas niigatensis]WPP53694.1 M14-type cytosolic carboxypeptidase [Catalinimonas niigatensis]
MSITIKYDIITSLFLLSLFVVNSCQQTPDHTSAISIHTDFEGGNLGEVEQVAENHWECAVAGESDWDNRNRQASWYYFRVEGAKDQELIIDLTKLLGEYNYKPGAHAITAETRPVISYNQKEWRHLSDDEVAWNEEKVELRLKLKPEKDTMWIAHQPPYTTARLDELLSSYQDDPLVKRSKIGESADQKPLHLLTITNPDIPLEQKKVIWLMARQHSWESGTSWVMEGALRYLLDSAEGKALLNKHLFQVMPMADPDGVARGGVRFNKFGHDLNRNWDLVKPDEMPEIHAQKTAIVNWLLQGHRIGVFLTLHNTEAADYVQGPDLPEGHKFWKYMSEYTSFRAEEGLRKMPETTTAGQPGRMTVNQALWAEQKVPAYLMELKVEKVDKLNARRSVEDWLALGPGVVKALVAAVD